MKAQETKTIPKGYKQTEVGVIPEDWGAKKLGEILKIKHGKSQKDVVVLNGKYPILATGGEIGRTDKYLFNKPSVLIGRKGTIDVPQYKDTPFWTVDTLFYTDINNNNDPKFVYYKFLLIDWYSYNEASGVPSLNAKTIERIGASFPSNKLEQTIIASALSDVDTLIINLEKLIAKKKAVKQGAMQELLTGKRRLPGFSGEWEKKKLSEIGEITGSGIDKKSNKDEAKVRLVNYLDVFHRDFIYSKDLNHWVTASTAQLQKCKVKTGDIFFTPSSEMRYDIAVSAVAMEDIDSAGYSYHVIRFRLFEDWDLLFRAYIFKTKFFINQAETVCEGSGKRYVISLTKFREMSIKYPPDVKEQKAISSVLYEVDCEIKALERKLNKYKNIKIGMMQQLLTGKIRIYDKQKS